MIVLHMGEFSIVAASFPIHQEIEGASAGVFGLIGGHIG
jgi:hypothetical protein